MGALRKLVSLAEKNLTWLQLLTGGSLVTGVGYVSKVIAERTTWITTGGPYAIWLATLGGALLAALVYGALAWGRLQWIRAEATNIWKTKSADKINPMETTFRSQRISLRDLMSPFEPVVRGKTFIDCEIIGPESIVFHATKPGSGGMQNVTFYETYAVKTRDNAPIGNSIVLEDCNLLRGKAHKLILFIPESGVEKIKEGLPGIPWLTAE